jgi:ABC-type multidrug transport system ATPase subunit
MIHIEHLSKSYTGPFLGAKKVMALNDISLNVDNGKTLIVSGTKNSGKSSLLKIIAAMMKADSGNAEILGHNLRTSAAEIRKQTVYLSNIQPFFGYLSVKEHLSYFAALKGLKQSEVKSRIDEFLKNWDLKPGQAVSKLPIEQQMLLGLLQALIVRPKIILMDDPVLGLDFFTAKPIFDLIAEAKKEGIGIVYACSNLSNAEMSGDEIIFLHQGKLAHRSDMQIFLQNNGNSLVDGFIKIISEANKTAL